MKVAVYWFGRRGGDPFRRQVDIYVERVARRWPAEDIVLKPRAGGRDADPTGAVQREWRTARRRIPDGWQVVALDESGRQVSTAAFSDLLARSEQTERGLAFIIGSDLGLAGACLSDADHVLGLSRMTLPHRLARLLLWEQLFRGVSVLEGTAYHRSGVG